MNLTDYVIEWIFDSTAGKDPVNFLIHICPPSGKPYLVRGERGIIFNDPTREILVSLNEPSGSYLFSLTSFRKQAFFGVSVK